MKSKLAHVTLGLHAGLLLLAATRFTVVSWMWGRGAWAFDYFQYAHSNGWGFPYRSDYSLPVVLAYLAAHLLGVAACLLARGRVRGAWTLPALILCLLGSLSFSLEASHWLWSHHLSWIVSCPAASLLLAVGIAFQLHQGKDAP